LFVNLFKKNGFEKILEQKPENFGIIKQEQEIVFTCLTIKQLIFYFFIK